MIFVSVEQMTDVQAMMAELIKKHGGRIQLVQPVSEPGGKSFGFFIDFPSAIEEQHPAKAFIEELLASDINVLVYLGVRL